MDQPESAAGNSCAAKLQHQQATKYFPSDWIRLDHLGTV